MILNLARAAVLALAAVIALASAPALAQSTTSVALACPWKGIMYEVFPDNSKAPGAFRIDAAKCGAENVWQLPLPGGVTASFKTAADVSAYLKENARLHANALSSKDHLVQELRGDVAGLKALLAAAEADQITVRNRAVDGLRAAQRFDAMKAELDAARDKLKAAQEEIDTLKKAAAPKPADS